MHFKQGASVVSVGSLRMQSRVQPGTRMTVQATATNTAELIAGDPDACDAGFFWKGYQIDVELLLNGQLVDVVSDCVAGSGGSLTGEFEFITPSEPGTYDVEVLVRGADSGHVADSTSQTLTIEEDAPEEDNPGDDDEQGDSYLPCFMDPDRACTTGETLTFAGMGGGMLLLFLLAILA
jgi:hypothetical protein